MTKELAKLLATALVEFIYKDKPSETLHHLDTEHMVFMTCLKDEAFDTLNNMIQSKLSSSKLTEFEKALAGLVSDVLAKEPQNPDVWVVGSGWADKLLAIAKKELLSYADESNPKIEAIADLERTYFSNPDKLPKWLKDDIARKELNARTKGYNKGYKDASEEYMKCESYHFPTVTVRPLCWEPGGTCTNPQMDCINCPRKTSG